VVSKHLAHQIILLAAIFLSAFAMLTPRVSAEEPLPPLHVSVGGKAPDFELPAGDGRTIKLSELAGHNVLIDFYRGYWCAYCMSELGEIVKHNKELMAIDVEVLGVSADPPENALVAQDLLKAPFPILSDSKHQIMAIYGTDSPTDKGPDGEPINIPTLILVDKTGTIRWIHQASDIRVRPSISEVLAQAKKLKQGERG
jgi:peroxiredoxin Q/BCP